MGICASHDQQQHENSLNLKVENHPELTSSALNTPATRPSNTAVEKLDDDNPVALKSKAASRPSLVLPGEDPNRLKKRRSQRKKSDIENAVEYAREVKEKTGASIMIEFHTPGQDAKPVTDSSSKRQKKKGDESRGKAKSKAKRRSTNLTKPKGGAAKTWNPNAFRSMQGEMFLLRELASEFKDGQESKSDDKEDGGDARRSRRRISTEKTISDDSKQLGSHLSYVYEEMQAVRHEMDSISRLLNNQVTNLANHIHSSLSLINDRLEEAEKRYL